MLKIDNFRRRFFSITLILTLLVLCSFPAHKYYTSITKIEINENEHLVKIYTQVFVDDFERLLKNRYELSAVDFTKMADNEKKIVQNYILQKFKIKANRAPLKLKFLGCELKNELLYIFVEAPIENTIKRFDVENLILCDLFAEQQNTIDIKNKKSLKSLHLNKEKPSGTVYY